jgi:raffinose/stachyose/melibiose transport system permease protein
MIRARLGWALVLVVVGSLIALSLGPAVWVILSSFKSTTQTLSGVSPFWPAPFTIAGYRKLVESIEVTPFLNTLLYAGLGAVGAIASALLAAYPLTRFPIRHGGLLATAFTVAIAIPVVGLATPEFFVMRTLRLLDSPAGMVIFYSALFFPISFVILRAFLAGLPREMEEAAVIDGAGYWRILWRVVLPLARPAIATALVVAFVGIWNEFFFANLFVSSPDVQNVQTALAGFKGQFRFDASALLAGTSISMLVPMGIFLALQRQVIAGLTAGASR